VDRFGTFYLYGMVFGQEWVPIADTWMYAAEQVCLDVGVFFVLFVAHSIPLQVTRCSGNQAAAPRSFIESPWFKGVEVVYWLWRVSELVALASFYGGVWPTLVQNILVLWMLFVGVTLGTALWTPENEAARWDSWAVVEGCSGCAKGATLVKAAATTTTFAADQGDCHVVDLEYKLGFSSSSGGSSASSTPFNRSPRTKNRKRSRRP
jgi:hypothetical protein